MSLAIYGPCHFQLLEPPSPSPLWFSLSRSLSNLIKTQNQSINSVLIQIQQIAKKQFMEEKKMRLWIDMYRHYANTLSDLNHK